MPRFRLTHPKTNHSIATDIPREAAELRSQGYRDVESDPADTDEPQVQEPAEPQPEEPAESQPEAPAEKPSRRSSK